MRAAFTALIAGALVFGAVPADAADSIGMVDPASGEWHLSAPTGEVTTFFFGNPADVPFTGDWDCDGIDTPGLYRQSDGFVYLRNTNDTGIADVEFFFGDPGDVPVAGDFDADGCDTVSIYRPDEGRFFVINELGSAGTGLGAADFDFLFGDPGDQPFIGDFDGDGVDTAGLHRESTGRVYFRNTLTTGIADADFIFGDPDDRFVAGDWTGFGFATPALFRPSDELLYYRFTNTAGFADQVGQFGGDPDWLPVAGNFGAVTSGPLQPDLTSVFAGAGSGEIDVVWGTVGAATAYRVYWSLLPNATKVPIAEVSQAANQFGLPYPEAAKRFYVDGLGSRFPRTASSNLECYRIAALRPGGEGPLSKERCFPASAFFAPAAGTGGGSGEITITWKPPAGADHYDVYWSLLPGGSKAKVGTVTDAADQFGLPWTMADERFFVDGLPPNPFRSLTVGKNCYVVVVHFSAADAPGAATGEACFAP